MEKPLKPKNNALFKLYGVCLDQIKFYNGITWQFPTALAGVNLLALNFFRDNGIVILIMSIVNFSLLYSFYRHLVNFGDIVDATREIEKNLSDDFNAMIPKFNPPFIKSSWLLFITMFSINCLLLIFALMKI